MSEQQREPQPQASVTQQGGSPDGRGEVRMAPEEEVRSYYGRAVLKEPVWSWEIPWYFFAGGLAGASSNLALVARLTGNDTLARRARIAAVGGAAVSPVLLIMDLGKPERFYNMLRVFKPTSPMSVGTWVLSAFGSTTGLAASCRSSSPRVQRPRRGPLLRSLRPLRRQVPRADWRSAGHCSRSGR